MRAQKLLKDRRQLHLAPCAARGDIGHHLFQISHALRESLHVQHRGLNLVQVVTHDFKGFAQAALEGCLEFLLHRRTHGFELGIIVLLKSRQLAFHGAAQAFEFLFVAAREGPKLRAESLELLVLEVKRIFHRGRQSLDFLARGICESMAEFANLSVQRLA